MVDRKRCRNFAALCMVLLFLFSSALPAYAGEEVLTLEEALKEARKANPAFTSLKLQVERAQILKEKAAENIMFLPVGQLLVTPGGQALVNSYEQASIQHKTLQKQLEDEEKRLEKDVINAYVEALSAWYELESARMQKEDMEKRLKVMDRALAAGVIPVYDRNRYFESIKMYEDTIKLQEDRYRTAQAELRKLMGKNVEDSWQLATESRIRKFAREKLDTEIVRAYDASAAMLGAKTALELEQIKIYWPSFDYEDRYMDKINLHVKELDYETAKRNLAAALEQLYRSIDMLEKQIELKEKVLEDRKRELAMAETRYRIGVAPAYGLMPSDTSLESLKTEIRKTENEIKMLKAKLAASKANFLYLTGKTPYQPADWKDIE